jgi:glycosyltransferase involved in cell wall biosynthesis
MTNIHNSISVIIPVYNRCILIDRAIKSVLGQTLPPDEIIVIDDGSTDGTDKIIKNNHPDIILLKQKNRGVSCALKIDMIIGIYTRIAGEFKYLGKIHWKH